MDKSQIFTYCAKKTSWLPNKEKQVHYKYLIFLILLFIIYVEMLHTSIIITIINHFYYIIQQIHILS
jgi:hypothetical protein